MVDNLKIVLKYECKKAMEDYHWWPIGSKANELITRVCILEEVLRLIEEPILLEQAVNKIKDIQNTEVRRDKE